nr:SIR2 family protein [Hyphomicrobium sulfonivorans]
MGALADHLKTSIENGILGGSDERLWDQFIAELAVKDLESALQAVTLSERLSDHIVEQTWKLIEVADARVFEAVLADANYLPLARLYRHLFNSTHRTISVVTPNYDRLAEYAADAAGYCHHTGFSYGYLRQRQSGSRLLLWQDKQQARTVDVWKVHGCLDWFVDQDGQVIALTSARSIPTGRRPAIVTPGIEKYKRTHGEPFRSIIAGADVALSRAGAYLCVGFGFNDGHIQPKLLERWKRGDALLVVLTKILSDSARKMLGEANGQKFLALEEAANGTRMWSHKHPAGVPLDGVHLWRLPDFLDHTT